MKKFFTLIGALLLSTSTFADVAADWEGSHKGVLNVAMVDDAGNPTGVFDPTATTIPITKNDDGTLNLTLKNLVLYLDGNTMPVGTVNLKNVKATMPMVLTNEPVVLEDGDDANFKDDEWMAASVNLICGGSVPVSLTGTYDDNFYDLTINIDISKVIGYNVKCSFRSLRYAYQMPNADFEDAWTTQTKKNRLGSVLYKEETPASWHSFYTAEGAASGLAFMVANQLGTLTQVTGYDGTGSAAQIKSTKNMLGSISNGNLTNGIINMGSGTATDDSNYNFSKVSDETASLRFSTLPDSVSAYFIFEPKNAALGRATMTASLHGDYNYTDPESGMKADSVSKYKVAYGIAYIDACSKWTRVSAPIVYAGDNYKTITKRYLLMSFSTNEGKGAGSDGDKLSIDHIRFIYNSQLDALQVNGADVADFNSDTLAYSVPGKYNEDAVVAHSNGKGATVSQSYSEDDNTLTITVQGSDYLINPSNVHVYTVTFTGEPVSIKPATALTEGTVNVYTIEGVLLRKGVKPQTATEGLAKGYYIVGNKKVLVK